jgi:tetratricopeptide (TPR) repeat protein
LKSKAQLQLGEADQAVKACLDAVSRYGADPSQKGVDDILQKLGSIIKTRLDENQQKQARTRLRQAREEAVSPTLQMRLDVLLAELDGTQAALGRKLLAEEKSLEPVPPPALSLMCSALLENKDFSRSQEFYDYFAEYYEDSPFRASSYQLRGLDLYGQKNTNEAYDLAVEALGMYGGTEETGWAQLMKGKIELERGEYQQAAETFNMVFSLREWRPISAEAMFRMAEAWEAQKNYEKAFAFFQRTYLLYKAYDEGRWAAEGYLRSAQCLRKMGRVTAARNTYRAMLLDEYVRDLPQAEEAKKVLGPAETAVLLAGGTNTMEIVELEVGK